MKKGLTLVVNIIDASGSMASRVDDVIGSINESISKYRETEGETRYSMYTFNHTVSKLVDYVDVSELDSFKFYANGMTALYDAMGYAIDDIGAKLACLPEDERPEQVQFMIVTDGEENSSRKFTAKDIKNKIEHQIAKYSWVFTYLGSNQDAILVGTTMGIDAKLSATYTDKNLSKTMRSVANKMTLSKGEDYSSAINMMSYSDAERESFVK